MPRFDDIDRLKRFRPPYIPFPKNPKIVEIDGHPAHNYISQNELSRLIDDFSQHVNLNWYDTVCINLACGEFFANELFKRQSFNGNIINIEYHEDKRIVTPVPKWLRGRRFAVVDDVLDKFITGELIRSDAPLSDLLYMTKKKYVTPENRLNGCYWACEVDSEWLLGGGMNGEEDGDNLPDNWGRNLPAIAAKILTT